MTNLAPQATPAIGKRYRCQTCGAELLCVKAGDGTGSLQCCSQPLLAQGPKLLPPSD